jgi:hypothetical protein
MNRRTWLIGALVLVLAGPALAKHKHELGALSTSGPPGATLLIVRHAEKPNGEGGPGLIPAGEARAKAYVQFFRPAPAGVYNTVWRDEPPQKLDALVATADTAKSARPRLTLEPLAKALNLPIQQPCTNDDVDGLARWLSANEAGKTTLIAWHHGRISALLAALGADPATLVPGGIWPDDMYDWVIELRYDAAGRLMVARRIVEGLTSGG